MAAGDLATFPMFRQLWMTGSIAPDFNSWTVYCALLSTLTAAGIAAMDFFDDVTECSAGGVYAAGGASVSAQTISVSATYPIWMAGNVVWAAQASSPTNARWAVLYRNSGTPGTSPLIAYLDLGSDRNLVTGDLTLAWNAGGIMRFL